MNEPESLSPEAAPPPLPPRLEVAEVNQAKRKWVLELHPDHFALHNDFDPQPLIYTRAELWDKADTLDGVRVLAIKKPRALGLQFTKEAFATFQQWLGPPAAARLRSVFKRRFGWGLPVAVIIGVSSLPMKGNPEKGITDVPFDPYGMGLAVGLVALSLWVKYRPTRVLFLFDALWFVLAGGRIFLNIVTRDQGWGWGIFGVLLLLMAVSGLRWFKRFAPAGPADAPK